MLRLVELAELTVERQDLLADQLDEIERDLDAIFKRRGRRWTAR